MGQDRTLVYKSHFFTFLHNHLEFLIDVSTQYREHTDLGVRTKSNHLSNKWLQISKNMIGSGEKPFTNTTFPAIPILHTHVKHLEF